MSDKKTSIENAVERLTANYRKEELFLTKSGRHLPVRAATVSYTHLTLPTTSSV